MSKIIKAGVIGVGFIGPAHIENLRRLGHKVVALAASNQDKADQSAGKMRVPKAYGNWRNLIKDPEVEVVHIASPNYLHFPQAKAALEAGKHVICEKPLAMNTEQTAALVKMSKDNDLVTAVNFNMRYYPLVQEARAQIREEKLGEKIYIIRGGYLQDWLLLDTDWNWRLESDQGGNLLAVADIGFHWIDLITYITGTKVTEVCADLETFLPRRRTGTNKREGLDWNEEGDSGNKEKEMDLEEYGSVLMRFDNGAKGVMTVSQVSSGRKNRLFFEINGSESSFFWNSERPNRMLIGHREKPNEWLTKDPALMSESAAWSASYPGGHPEGFPDTFKQLSASVYDYLSRGDFQAQPDFPTFQDGHEIQAVGDTILRSSMEQKWIEVSYE